MKTNWLFPHRYRLIGWLVLIPSLVLGLAVMYADFGFNFLTVSGQVPGKIFSCPINLTDEVAALGLIAGLLMIGFSREAIEDEMVSQLRLESLQWAVYIHYAILAVVILLVHGDYFLDILIYNLFTLLIFFIIRFRLALRRSERAALVL